MLPQIARVLALTLTTAAALGGLTARSAEPPKVDFPQASPPCTIKQQVGLTNIEIDYCRPSVRGRKIFGGLEAYGKVWRTGANAATKISFSTPVTLNGTAIPAGTYELFTIPNEKLWTVILHKNAGEWGAYEYKPEDDVARITATPETLAEPVETFTIGLNDLRDDSATLNLVWEKTRVPVKIQLDVVGTVTAQIQAAMASDATKKPYFQSAMFYLDHNLDLKQALAWMNQALAEQPDAFWAYYHKARILARMGDKAGALASAQKSIELAEKSGPVERDEYTRLNRTLIASLQ